MAGGRHVRDGRPGSFVAKSLLQTGPEGNVHRNREPGTVSDELKAAAPLKFPPASVITRARNRKTSRKT